jgi:predicted nucleotidyltransferase
VKFLDDSKIPDHPYPELRKVLGIFVDNITAELGRNVVGVYLVGSLATGDFDLDSDVDFLVVTNTSLSEDNMERLQDIQSTIHDLDDYPAKHLEGSYISIADLNDWSTVGEKPFFYFDNGSTRYEWSTHDNKWHVRWILRERGITLAGQRPETILSPIPRIKMFKEIKETMLREMEVFRHEMDRPLGFWNSRFGQSFFVLTYCRMLHTLHSGTVQSKKAGVDWARQVVDPRWVELIDQAWEEREGVRFGAKIGQQAEPADLQATLEFMKYAVTQAEEMGHGAYPPPGRVPTLSGSK